jgi:hypothetical protein
LPVIGKGGAVGVIVNLRCFFSQCFNKRNLRKMSVVLHVSIQKMYSMHGRIFFSVVHQALHG